MPGEVRCTGSVCLEKWDFERVSSEPRLKRDNGGWGGRAEQGDLTESDLDDEVRDAAARRARNAGPAALRFA